MLKPMCRLCQTRHALYEPHAYSWLAKKKPAMKGRPAKSREDTNATDTVHHRPSQRRKYDK